MGAIAAEYSTKVLFTSDNPRDEDPDSIIEQMSELTRCISRKP